jgi:uncharacterized protein
MDSSAANAEIGQLYCNLADTDMGTAVSVILKLRGETCDIDCLYCYEKRKEVPGGARLGVAQVRRLTALFRGRPLAVELHGGEPLTAGRQHLGEVLAELAAQPAVIRVSLQTNGLQLDETWLDLFDSVYPDLHIGISLDGDPEGNAWRVGYDGAPTYPQVARALRLLAERGRTAGVITAVTSRVLGRAEAVLDHLTGFEAINAISFVPCFDAAVSKATASPSRRLAASRILQQANVSATGGPAWATTPDEYAEFVLSAAIHWVTSGAHARVKLEPAVSVIRRLRGLDTGFCHFSNLKCDHVFTLYPDGRFGSCDELPWPAAQLTHLNQLNTEWDVAAAQQASTLLSQGRSLMAKCVPCAYRRTCGGGCVATRWRFAQATGGDDTYCDYRMRLVDGIAALLAQPGVPSGVWCRQVHSWPRDPNSMADVAGFLARWDDGRTTRSAVRLHTSDHGNINIVGLPGVQEADDLGPHHPQWRQAIEPGAWPLVDVCTSGWGLITYDSCQGHAYTGLDLDPAVRRVGILLRDPDEYAAAAAALCRAVTEATDFLQEPVRILVGRAELTCETTGRRLPVLDLALDRASGYDWTTYFSVLDDATVVVADSLRRNPPSDDLTCACPAPRRTAALPTGDVHGT